MSRSGGGGGLLRLLPDYASTAWSGLFGHRLRSAPLRVVQAAVLSPEGVVLSVRRNLRGWELPGGNPDPGEADEQAVVREVFEETGLHVVVERHTGSYYRTGFLPHEARVFRCRVTGGRLTPSPETPRVRFFALDRIPDTLLPWYRGPLADAVSPDAAPAVRREHLGSRAILAGMRIDLRMRLSNDEAG